MRTTSVCLFGILTAALCLLTACTTTPEPSPSPPQPTGTSSSAMVEGVPGGVIVNTMKVSARITALDPSARKVTLLKPDGEEVTVKVGDYATNYDQLKVGDLVNATLTEELVVYLDGKAPAAADGAAGLVALAPKGEQPAGVVAETTQITATIKEIDGGDRTATLIFQDGTEKTFPVRDDIDLSSRMVGEKVVFLVTEIMALEVETP